MVTELKRPIIGFLVLLIAIAVVFSAYEVADDFLADNNEIATGCVDGSGANCTLGENATATFQGATDDMVSWLPLLALVIIAGVVIAYTSGAFKGV